MKTYAKYLKILFILVLCISLSLLCVACTQDEIVMSEQEANELFEWSQTSDEVTIVKYKGTLSDVEIPSKIGDCVVVSIAEFAFQNADIKSVVIPSTVKSIGANAFEYCYSLASVTFNSGSQLSQLGNGVFYNCGKLTNINLQKCEKLASLPTGTFSDCSKLANIILPDSVTSIGSFAFFRCEALSNITLPEMLTEIEEATFQDCESLHNITIPEKVVKIGRYAFFKCKVLEKVEIPANVQVIEEKAFMECSELKNVTFDANIKLSSIGANAFTSCQKMETLIIPASVKTIGMAPFSDCVLLKIFCEASSVQSGWNNEWNYGNNSVYWYSQNQPTTEGNFWHYSDGKPIAW